MMKNTCDDLATSTVSEELRFYIICVYIAFYIYKHLIYKRWVIRYGHDLIYRKIKTALQNTPYFECEQPSRVKLLSLGRILNSLKARFSGKQLFAKGTVLERSYWIICRQIWVNLLLQAPIHKRLSKCYSVQILIEIIIDALVFGELPDVSSLPVLFREPLSDAIFKSHGTMLHSNF